ncbi:hypothetical protein F4804DRAFT_140426 [Jackrogersella minutella]|nr:hypothetical protein F4804DRAFT_140426 [Jackrogersella minutella]
MSGSVRDSQPGLELAPSSDPEVSHTLAYSNGPEVYRESDQYPTPVSHPAVAPYANDGSLHNVQGSYSSSQGSYGYYNAPGKELLPRAPVETGAAVRAGIISRKKLWILIGIIVTIAVIIGAVVGGVVGSKASGSGSNTAPDSDSISPPSNGSDSVNTTAVRANTRLAVTGRRIPGDGFTSRLFWQGGDDKIRTAKYTSTGANWEAPLVFDGFPAKPGSPIAATIYQLYPQFEFFYLDNSSTFRGLNFGEDETVPKIDSIETDRAAFTVDGITRMSSYWPYVIYQNPNSTFRREVFDSKGQGWFNDTMQGWFNPDVVPLGDNNTGIAVVPTVKEYKGPYAAGIAYRDQDGRLSIFSFGGDDTDVSWKTGSPNTTIPAGTSIAAIAVGRPNSNTTNTWILYQDANNKIQSVWQDDENGWQGPQEIGDADAGTDIACLTEVVCDEPEQVLLSEQTDMRRCYYQYNGAIQEKRFTSSIWVDGDTIPME